MTGPAAPGFIRNLADIAALVPAEHITVVTQRSTPGAQSALPRTTSSRVFLSGARTITEPAWRGSAPAVLLGLIETVTSTPSARVVITCGRSSPESNRPDVDAPDARALARAEAFARRGDRIVLLVAPAENGHVIPVSAPTSLDARLARVLRRGRSSRHRGEGTTFDWTGTLIAPAQLLLESLAISAPELVRLFLFCAGEPNDDVLAEAYQHLDEVDLTDLLVASPELWLVSTGAAPASIDSLSR